MARLVRTAVLVSLVAFAGLSCGEPGAPASIGGVRGTVDGRIDPTRPNALVGTAAQRHELNDGSIATQTVTWNLSH